MKKPSASLVNILIAKAVVETVLVGTLAVVTYLTVFPPYFHGWGEATATSVAGWAVNNAEPWDRVEVQLFIDGEFFAQGVANKSRPDVPAAGWSKDEWHGYEFPLAALEQGTHEARVYALHSSGDGARKTLQLLGDPITFSIDANRKIVMAGQ